MRNLIKYIAAAIMLVDHIGVVFFSDNIVFKIVGRLAFPLFAFFISEGFFFTRNKKKYLLTILTFAIISQIPYGYMLNNFFKLNILFTFTCSLIIMLLINKIIKKTPESATALASQPHNKQTFDFEEISENKKTTNLSVSSNEAYFVKTNKKDNDSYKIKLPQPTKTNIKHNFKKDEKRKKEKFLNESTYVIILTCFCISLVIINSLCPLDYGLIGVLLPVLFYYFRNKKSWSYLIFFVLMNILTLFNLAFAGWVFEIKNYYQIFSLFSISGLLLYHASVIKNKDNEEIKPKSKALVLFNKYFFYIFYPSHLAILVLIKLLI